MFEHIHKIHLIGANGVGVSAVGKLFLTLGKQVSGSDLHGGVFFDELVAMGAQMKLGHTAEHLPDDTDLVVYSSAVPATNPEREAAQARGVKQLGFAECLGELAKGYFTIAITGTHGKSTTTAMIGKMLEDLGLDPTVIVGSRVPGWELGNVRVGASPRPPAPGPRSLLVLETCEHMAHHLKVHADIGVITNVEFDHPDFYRDLDHVKETMMQWEAQCKQVVWVESEPEPHLNLKVPGHYNERNAAGALAVARLLQLDEVKAKASLESFAGIWRRFEHLGVWNEADVYSDYGHHPTAVRETLKAAREAFSGRRLVHIFQPHQHARTEELFDDFASVLGEADVTILVEIYGVAGRTESETVSTNDLVLAVKERKPGAVVYYADGLSRAEELVKELVESGDILFFQGAGDIDDVARTFAS